MGCKIYGIIDEGAVAEGPPTGETYQGNYNHSGELDHYVFSASIHVLAGAKRYSGNSSTALAS
jgi:hypothetical protein